MAREESDLGVRGLTPEEARRRLEYDAIFEDTWDSVLCYGLPGFGKFGSHEARALITIARGKEPRVLGEVYEEVRKNDGLPPIP